MRKILSKIRPSKITVTLTFELELRNSFHRWRLWHCRLAENFEVIGPIVFF
jgi:hypothetical protein